MDAGWIMVWMTLGSLLFSIITFLIGQHLGSVIERELCAKMSENYADGYSDIGKNIAGMLRRRGRI